MKAPTHNPKHIFIVNPASGGSGLTRLIRDIRAVWDTAQADYDIYETRSPGDGEAYVRKLCREHADARSNVTPPEPSRKTGSKGTPKSDRSPAGLRLYACGGDGTLSEVVNGSYGYEFVETGCIPLGTGNDFVRNFPDRDFLDLPGQLRGGSMACDLIRYRCEVKGKSPDSNTAVHTDMKQEVPPINDDHVERFCVNMFNIGFDCNVVDSTDTIKKLPFMSGSLAYLGGIAANLIKKKGADLVVEYPDGYTHDGKLLLLSIANGCFCGGGIKGLPRARTDDGLMDVSLVKNVPRRTFIRLFPQYQKGVHLDNPCLADILRYTHESSLRVSPGKGNKKHSIKLCVDGEIFETGSIDFSIVPEAFHFILPA